MFKNPIWQEATRCLFTSPTKGLNSGLPRNHASQRSKRDWNSVSTNLGRGWTRLDEVGYRQIMIARIALQVPRVR